MSSSGYLPKLYINTATYASPTWSEISEARDLSMPLALGEVDASDRGSTFKKYDAGLIDMSIEWEMTYRNGNANFAALQTHVLARTTVEIAIVDDDIATSGTEGFRIPCKLFSQSFNFPLEDGMTVSMKAMPTYDATAGDPEWMTVS